MAQLAGEKNNCSIWAEGIFKIALSNQAPALGEKVKTVVSEAGTAGKSEVREFASTNNKT